MSAIPDLTTFLSLVANRRRADVIKAAPTAQDAGILTSLWRTAGNPDQGAIPTTAAVPDRSTVGAIGQINPGGGNEQFAYVRQLASQARATLMIADRLVHMGGLSGIVTTAQNVLTSALTRFTDGKGVIAAIEIYTQIGATGTTVTMDYTDEAGNAAQTSQAIDIGATGRREVGKILPMSLKAGDVGVKAVNTVTLVATTGTAGNFGVTLFKPLLVLPSLSESQFWSSGDVIQRLGGMIAKIPDGACLWPLLWGNTTGASMFELGFLEA